MLGADSGSGRGSYSGMSDCGTDRYGLLGVVLVTYVGFFLGIYFVRHTNVLVENLGTWKV